MDNKHPLNHQAREGSSPARLTITLLAICLPMLAATFLSGSVFKLGTLKPGDALGASSAYAEGKNAAVSHETETETRTVVASTTAQRTGTAETTHTAGTTSTVQTTRTAQPSETAHETHTAEPSETAHETHTAEPSETAHETHTAQATTTAQVSMTPHTVVFTDMQPGNTFYAQVQCLAGRDIVSGYSDGTFRPDNLVTRGQLAKIVSNASGFAEDPGAQMFEDVAPGSTFYVWINRLSMRGYMSGYNCGGAGEPCGASNMAYFRPNANATRSQTSKIVANAMGYNEVPTGQTFEDVPATHPFYQWVQALGSRGIMGGYQCGGPGEPCGPDSKPYFRPFNNVTRGQSAKIVANGFYPNCTP